MAWSASVGLTTVVNFSDDSAAAEVLYDEGTAFTALRPSGEVRVDENKMDAVASLGMIAKGTRVRITGVRGYSLIVEELHI